MACGMTQEVCRNTMQALTMAENAVVEPRKIKPYSCVVKSAREVKTGITTVLTVMKLADSIMAFAGISYLGWTCAQNLE